MEPGPFASRNLWHQCPCEKQGKAFIPVFNTAQALFNPMKEKCSDQLYHIAGFSQKFLMSEFYLEREVSIDLLFFPN